MQVAYSEGDWFSVPLKSGGWAVGIVARAPHTAEGKRDGIIFCYYFGPRRTEIPSIDDMGSLTPQEAIYAIRASDIHIRQGTWPVLGRLENWSRRDWPMPGFLRPHPDTDGEWLLIEYSDSEPNEQVRKSRAKPAERQLPSDNVPGRELLKRRIDEAIQAQER